MAVTNNNRIYISTNGGISWTPRENNRLWYDVAISSNGMKIFATTNNGKLYGSYDGGITWVIIEENIRKWRGIAISSDGKKLITSAYNEQIYTGLHGITWADPKVNDSAKDFINNTTTISYIPNIGSLPTINLENEGGCYLSMLCDDRPSGDKIRQSDNYSLLNSVTINFNPPATNPVLALFSMSRQGINGSLSLSQPAEIYCNTVNSALGCGLSTASSPIAMPNPYTITGAEAFGIVKFSGTHSSITITKTAGSDFPAFKLGVLDTICTTTINPFFLMVPQMTTSTKQYTVIKLRRATEDDFITSNIVLASGEPAYASDTKTFKIGNGSSDWDNLPAFTSTDINIYNIGRTNGNVSIDWASNKQSQRVTLTGTSTIIKGIGWPTSDISRQTDLEIYVSGNTNIAWSIVGSNWYNKPSSSVLPSGTHKFNLKSSGPNIIEGNYLGSKSSL